MARAQQALASVAAQTAAGQRMAGLGLAGKTHGSVFVVAGNRVIRPALPWNDQRTVAQCARITESR